MSWRRFCGLFWGILSIAALGWFASPAGAIIAEDPTWESTTSFNVNEFLGANRFYDAGYTGTRAVATVIDSGNAWNGHESLAHISEFVNAVGVASNEPTYIGSLGDFDSHGTAVAHFLGGRGSAVPGDPHEGIAPGATLWSGAVAISWDPDFGGVFEINNESVTTPFYRAMVSGINGRRTDVVNGSGGFGIESTGSEVGAIGLDALVQMGGVTAVISAGNFGPSPNSVIGEASAYNIITAGALSSVEREEGVFVIPAFFSSAGPSDYLNPLTGEIVPDVRATVDIVAPGEFIVGAAYFGATGSSTGMPAPDPLPTNEYEAGLGTSFAAPIVAGGAALLADVGYDRFAGGTSIDPRVIKTVLLNSADRHGPGQPGGFFGRPWDNGQFVDPDGVIRTTQSLDYVLGAGRINLSRAFDQYTAGTTDVAGTGGGVVEAIGWDLGAVDADSHVDYLISDLLQAGDEFSATLNWWVDRSVEIDDTGTNVTASGHSDNAFINLDLELWRLDGPGGSPVDLVASSESLYNNVELFSFDLPSTDHYMLRVLWSGVNYDRFGTTDDVIYGVAWSVAVPEPSAAVLLALGLMLVATRRAVRR